MLEINGVGSMGELAGKMLMMVQWCGCSRWQWQWRLPDVGACCCC